MLNSTDRKAIIKTIIIYSVLIICVTFGFDLFHQISFIHNNPEILAVISLVMLVVISEMGMPMEVCFLICGIAACLIMKVPLFEYGQIVINKTLVPSMLIIALSGAVVAILVRGDLLDAIDKVDKNKDVEKYGDLKHQISIFCLFKNLQTYIIKVNKKSRIMAAIIFLFQSMLLFVSSIVSISTLSAMMGTNSKNRSEEENSYMQAGMLCMCVSGCLLMFFVMKSPWWIFFSTAIKDQKISMEWPVSTLLYAIFSFIHGYTLLIRSRALEETEEQEQLTHPLIKRHFLIYIGLIGVFLILTLAKTISSLDKRALPVEIGNVINQWVVIILILILAAVILATTITRRIMQDSHRLPVKSDTIKELRMLMLGDLKSDAGIKAVIGLIVLMVAIVSFDEVITEGLKINHPGAAQLDMTGSLQLLSQRGIIALIFCVFILVMVYVIGIVLGSNFGTFSIGLIIFSVCATRISPLNYLFCKRWLIESMIIISTFCNQVSPDSSNATALAAGKQLTSKIIQKQAWKVKSFFSLSAYKVQLIAMLVCVLLSAVLSGTGFDVTASSQHTSAFSNILAALK